MVNQLLYNDFQIALNVHHQQQRQQRQQDKQQQ